MSSEWRIENREWFGGAAKYGSLVQCWDTHQTPSPILCIPFARAVPYCLLPGDRSQKTEDWLQCVSPPTTNVTNCQLPTIPNTFLRAFSILLLLAILFLPLAAAAQVDSVAGDEISILLNVAQQGSTYINSVLVGDDVYLPALELFQFLRIKADVTSDGDSVSGFFLNENTLYLIDYASLTITVGGVTTAIDRKDFIRTETNIHLRRELFGRVFGLTCTFNFRAMAVTLTTDMDLPVLREMQRERLRKNLSRISGEVEVDRRIAREASLASIGGLDWGVMSQQQRHGTPNLSYTGALGGGLLGGDVEAAVTGSTSIPWTFRQVQARWRHVDNDEPWMRQTTVGRLGSPAMRMLSTALIGAQLTNTPSVFRRSFGTYTISDYTQPEWTVELYVNNIIVDFVKTDASGLYRFEIPLSYGATNVELKFYGPWGEERSLKQSLTIPMAFLPEGEFEYSFTAGAMMEAQYRLYSQLRGSLGLGSRATISAGVEYIPMYERYPATPFASANVRLLDNVLFNGEFVLGSRMSGLMTFSPIDNVSVELQYTLFDPGQVGFISGGSEQRRLGLVFPVRTPLFNGSGRVSLRQDITSASRPLTTDMIFSGTMFGVSMSLQTSALISERFAPYIRSVLSSAFRLPGRIAVRPQMDFDLSRSALLAFRSSIEYQFVQAGWIVLSLERNIAAQINAAQINIRYDLPFAQANVSMRGDATDTWHTQTLRGTMAWDGVSGTLLPSNRTSVGKGAIVIITFLDLDNDGILDEGERRLNGLDVRFAGGRIVPVPEDTLIRVMDLEPFRTWVLDVSAVNFENISWMPRYKTYSIEVQPNQFREVLVPIVVSGEVVGRVVNASGRGMRGVIVLIRDAAGALVQRLVTGDDGEWSHYGLPPGSYRVETDDTQLARLRLVPDAPAHSFEIRSLETGDYVEGVVIHLRPQ